jgi:alcohol dehydrogenase
MDDIAALLQLVAEKRLKPVIHSVRPMHEAKISMREMIERKVFGKAILVP